MMTSEDRRILKLFAQRVREIEPRARIWAFGSRARGDAEEFSDLDMCVVVPEVTPEQREAIRLHAWEVGFAEARVIPTVVLSEEEFERGPMSASTLIVNILREGVAA